MFDNLSSYTIILGSQSPRRQQLLKGLDIDFTIQVYTGNEDFPAHLQREEIPVYLSQKKSAGLAQELSGNYLLLTCDTVVWINNTVLNKPAGAAEAQQMLGMLSGKTHEVYTGVTLRSLNHTQSFYDRTLVSFKPLTAAEIDYYIGKYKPFDKAGSYGVQEWIGYIAIDRMEGCFFNVMGLPLNKVYDALKQWPAHGNG